MFKFAVLIICLCISNAIDAAIYKCKDAQGRATFSDSPCAASEQATVIQTTPSKPVTNIAPPPAQSVAADSSADAPKNKFENKSDEACFNYLNTGKNFDAPDTTLLVSSSKKWVSVSHVGARQMITQELKSKNEKGVFVSKKFNCLLMGDGETINKGPYELIE